MEVLCARPAINPALPREQVNIVEWAMSRQKKGQLEQIVDTHIGSINLDSLRKFGETAEKCLGEYGNERPTMGDALWNLEYALQFQEAFVQSVTDRIARIVFQKSWDGLVIVSTLLDDATTSEVFSQSMDPKGR
ncbi:hypothetical protein ACSBR2_007506 [Camellia fascicularis]